MSSGAWILTCKILQTWSGVWPSESRSGLTLETGCSGGSSHTIWFSNCNKQQITLDQQMYDKTNVIHSIMYINLTQILWNHSTQIKATTVGIMVFESL